MKRQPTLVVLMLATFLVCGLANYDCEAASVNDALSKSLKSEASRIAGDPSYRSRKPVYVKFGLTKDGSKVMSVAFDESLGTGKGYDVIYADTDLDGSLKNATKVKGKVQKQTGTLLCTFPPVKVDVPCGGNPTGKTAPCSIEIQYFKLTSQGSSPRTQEFFLATANVTIPEGASLWGYSLRGTVRPSDSLAKAPVTGFSGVPKLVIQTAEDRQKKGQMGIALTLLAGESRIGSHGKFNPLQAEVVLKRPDGQVVHKATDRLDKFVFG